DPYALLEHVHGGQLETVDDLLRKHDTLAGRVLGHAAQMVDAPLPLLFGRALPGEHTEGNLVRSTQDRRADRRASVDDAPHVLVSRVADLRIRAQRVVLRRDYGVGGALEPQIVETLRPQPPLRLGEVADPHLATVVAHFLKLLH